MNGHTNNVLEAAASTAAATTTKFTYGYALGVAWLDLSEKLTGP